MYPVLLAVVPVLGIAARNPGQYRSSDLAIVLGFAALVAGVLTVAFFLALRRRLGSARAVELAGAVTALVLIWWYGYVPARAAIARISPGLDRPWLLVSVGVAATVVGLVWLQRQTTGRLRTISDFTTNFVGILAVILAAQTLITEARGPRAVRRSALARQLAVPVAVRHSPSSSPTSPPRDIYVIVLDGHANGRVLREVFGYDDSPFEDSLRALGFLVPRDVRSNYDQTYLSVASLLNAAHVTPLARDVGVASKDHTLPTYLVKQNRVARFLKAQGYRYVLFPSAWWAATANSPLADEEFDPSPGFDPMHALTRTELRLAVLRSSLARYLVASGASMVPMEEHFRRSFEHLGDMPSDPRPTFAFAHFLLPHVPYLLDEHCRPLAHEISDDMEADTPEQRVDYIGQVRCADRRVLSLVTSLLTRSSPAPVIIVVGDHGSRFADVDFYGHPERVSRAFIRERFGAFGAFYLPSGGAAAFHEPVTLVNVLGNVLRYYFDADLPTCPDSMYVSGLELYRFYPVDPSVMAPATRPDSDKGTS